MTGMLASVMSLEEADIVVNADVDVLDLKQPEYGVLGALEEEIIQSIVARYSGVVTISATIGDIPFDHEQIKQAIHRIKSTKVDIIKVGVFGKLLTKSLVDCLRQYHQGGTRIVLVFFPDLIPDYSVVLNQINSEIVSGVMLDTANKQSGSLLDCQTFEQLQVFLQTAKDKSLISGLAGSLKLDDIDSLLLLKPDYLGFRSAICEQSERTAFIDEQALRETRDKMSNATTESRF